MTDRMEMEPTTHAAASGVCNEVTTIPLEFFSYDDIPFNKNKSVPVRNRWIYVFRRHPWGTSLAAEIFIDENGTTELVNWRGQHWAGKDVRPATVGRDVFEVSYKPDRYDTVLFQSRVQLARERIETYTGQSGLGPVLRRGMVLDVNNDAHVTPLGDDCSGCRVYLKDDLSIAQQLHKRYEDALNDYARFLEDDDAASRQLLAELTLDVAKSIEKEEKDVWSWLDRQGDALRQEVQTYDERRQELEKTMNQCSAMLATWMRTTQFQEMLYDYTGTEELEDEGHDLQADLCEGLSQSASGRDYLDQVLLDRDSWYNKAVVPARDFHFGMARSAVGVTEKGLKLVQEFAASMAARSMEDAVSFVHYYFQMRLDLPPVELQVLHPGGRGGWHKATYTRFVKARGVAVRIDVEAVEGAMRARRAGAVARAGEVGANRIAAVLSIVNLALAGKYVASAQGREEQMLAVTALTGAMADVASSITSLMTQSRKVKIVGGVTTIVAGVLSYGGSLYQIATRSPDENAGVVAGLSLAALGGAFSAAAGFSFLTKSLFIGFGATGIGLIGIGLAALGAGLIWRFQESPLEKWFKRCPWANEKVPADARSISYHTNELFKILAGFSARCDILEKTPAKKTPPGSPFRTEYIVRLRIFPGLYFPERSVFKINGLTTGGHEVPDFVIERPESLRDFDDGSWLEVTRRSGRVHEISRNWKRPKWPERDYTYTITLDVLGDGQYEYNDEERKGRMQIVQGR